MATMGALFERQRIRAWKKRQGALAAYSGTDPEKTHAEFSAQRGVRQHSPEVLHYLANLPTTGHNKKLRKVARKILALRHPNRSCPPGEHMTFGTCQKVGQPQHEEALLEFEISTFEKNGKAWAADDEGNRWYISPELIRRFPPGTYFGRDAQELAAASREPPRRERYSGYTRKPWEDTMRSLLRRLEEGRGVKPVITWESLKGEILDRANRGALWAILSRAIETRTYGREGAWYALKESWLKVKDEGDAVSAAVDIGVDYIDDDGKEKELEGMCTLRIRRSADARGKMGNLTFSIDWSLNSNEYFDFDKDAEEITNTMPFAEFVQEYGGDWDSYLQDLAYDIAKPERFVTGNKKGMPRRRERDDEMSARERREREAAMRKD